MYDVTLKGPKDVYIFEKQRENWKLEHTLYDLDTLDIGRICDI